MVDLELANEGDLLITRNNKIGRFKSKQDLCGTGLLYIYFIENKPGCTLGYAVHRFGNFHPLTPSIHSISDVIAHLPSNTETPYYELYERLRIHRTSSSSSSRSS